MQLMRISKHLRYKKKYFNYFSFSNSLLYLENTLLAEPNKKKTLLVVYRACTFFLSVLSRFSAYFPLQSIIE